MRFMDTSRRRRSLFIVGALTGAAVLMSGALWRRSNAQDTDSTSEIAPGLSLRSVIRQTPQGQIRFWLVTANPTDFDLGLEIPDKTDVQKKRGVRTLAAQSGATVAVNGGFFAYGGAAVGAVKAKGTWQRLPWKSRTSLGWNSSQDAQIGPLSGSCQLKIVTPDGKVQLQQAALNGFSLPGVRTQIVDGFAVLTPQFARKYTLKAGEIALIMPRVAPQTGLALILTHRVQTEGNVELQSETAPVDYVVIARGQATQTLDAQRSTLSYSMQTTPDWNRFNNILGAGPRLVANGQVKTTEIEEEFRPDVVARGPRTAVGLDAQKNWLLLVADGRSAYSVGLTIPETATLFQQLGATEAMNLDGGSSTQLVVNGELLNTPSGFDPVNPTRPREVQVSNALTLKAR